MGKRVQFQIINGNFQPIEGAHLSLSQKPSATTKVSITDADGKASISIDFDRDFCLVIIADDHFPYTISNGEIPQPTGWDDEPHELTLKSLPEAKNFVGWWHCLMGLDLMPKEAGKNIIIGVIDSGCATHPHLEKVQDCGCVVQGEIDTEIAGRDTQNHGTAVLGLLAGNPDSQNLFSGFAPNAKVLSVKAFDEDLDKSLKTGTASEIDRSIFYLIEQKVDLINCSFENEEDRDSTAQMIDEAFDNGILCICAAGNNRSVAFPARHPKAVAVSAIGVGKHTVKYCLLDTCAPTPHHSVPEWKDDFFLASFSGRGEKIGCCAPGVGLITTAIPRNGLAAPYQIVYGTSFAAPLVCGLLAVVLGADLDYQKLPRDAARAQYALAKLVNMCVSTGLLDSYQGAGLVKYPAPVGNG